MTGPQKQGFQEQPAHGGRPGPISACQGQRSHQTVGANDTFPRQHSAGRWGSHGTVWAAANLSQGQSHRQRRLSMPQDEGLSLEFWGLLLREVRYILTPKDSRIGWDWGKVATFQ